MIVLKIRTLMCLSALVLLSACEQSGAPESNSNDAPFADAATSLQSRLLTGADDQNSASFWQCHIDTQGARSVIPIRFWENGSGFAGSRSMTWSVQDSAVTMQFENSKTTLNKLQMQGAEASARFDAVDGLNNSVLCDWAGPLLNTANTAPLADDTHGLEELITGTGVNTNSFLWSCSFTNDGSIVSQQFQFLSNKTGTVDGMASTWRVDDRFRLVITSEQSKIYLYGIQFSGEDSAKFTAQSKSRTADCSR